MSSSSSSSSSNSWNTKKEAYYGEWSKQLKIHEYNNVSAHVFYRRQHFVIGALGALMGVATLFSQLSGLIVGGGGEETSTSLGLKIAGVVMVALLNAVIGILMFHQPSALSETHRLHSVEYKKLWRRIDVMLLQPRADREHFENFTERFVREYEQLEAKAETTPMENPAHQSAKVITLGVGSILGSSSPPSSPKRHTHDDSQHVIGLSLVEDDNGDNDEVLNQLRAVNERRFDKIKRTATNLNVNVLRRAEEAEVVATAANGGSSSQSSAPLRFFKGALQQCE
jgi:hypothetical protein